MAAPRLLLAPRVFARAASLAPRPSTIPTAVNLSSPAAAPRISAASRLRLACAPRLQVGARALVTMLPLHSAVASARLQSALASESQYWGWVTQGISMPL